MADGKITIETGIDSSGIQKDAQKLEQTLIAKVKDNSAHSAGTTPTSSSHAGACFLM